MIDEVQVENLALIRKATLRPSSGMTVLTGETGAGKTALLSALKLLMGQRSDRFSVREGSSGLSVAGRFFALDANGHEDLPDADDDATPRSDARSNNPSETLGNDVSQDKPASPEDVVVCRRIGADGRSRVEIDGKMASVSQLAALVGESIDLCGQHEHQQLLKLSTHVRLLDAWAAEELQAPLAAYRQAFFAAAAAQAELQRLEKLAESSSEELERARFVLRQIDAVQPEPGEYESLKEELALAENSEALCRAAFAGCEYLSGEGGAQEGLASALHALDAVSSYDPPLAELAASLRDATYVVEDVSRELSSYREGLDFDPEDLQWKQERIALLQSLTRSFGPTMDDVLANWKRAQEEVAAVDDSAFLREKARKNRDGAEEELCRAARELAAKRAAAAPRFAQAVTEQMRRLEMRSASLVCQVSDLARQLWTRNGSQQVEFLFQPAGGMQPRPLTRIASGGEVSRVMLAIKVVLGGSDSVSTLVFDEVDAGVGGSTALALAEVLADLAKTHQVIVVTHLAQIAAVADCHYLVQKTYPALLAMKNAATEEGVGPQDAQAIRDGWDAAPETSLICLSTEERPAEIARMLSGSVTDASLATAREMLGL